MSKSTELRYDCGDLRIGRKKIAELYDGSGRPYFGTEEGAEEWGKRIAVAVNVHDELVAALRDLIYGSVLDEFNRNDDGLEYDTPPKFKKRVDAARAALAKVTGDA